jgi:heat shock protein HslJ
MKKYYLALGLSTALIFLSSCAASQPSSGGDLTGQVWALSELKGKSLATGTGISAQFTSTNKVSGSAGCNRYSGSYTVSGSSITFSSIASTMMACDTLVMAQESTYLNALGEAKTYTVKGNELSLFDSGGSTLAVYDAQTQDLSGTSWNVISYNNGKQAVTSVMIGSSLTADFGSDGTLSGNSGCNTYSGAYKLNGAQITVGPLASTKKFCNDPAGVMDQESQYLAALQSAASYLVEGNTLELRTQEGALAAQFTKK